MFKDGLRKGHLEMLQQSDFTGVHGLENYWETRIREKQQGGDVLKCERVPFKAVESFLRNMECQAQAMARSLAGNYDRYLMLTVCKNKTHNATQLHRQFFGDGGMGWQQDARYQANCKYY